MAVNQKEAPLPRGSLILRQQTLGLLRKETKLMQQETEALLRQSSITQQDGGKSKANNWQGRLSPSNTGNSAMLRDI